MMTRVRWTALFAAAALLLVALPAAAGRARFEERLQRAIASGAVDARKADLYRLYRLRAAERLPEVLRDAEGLVARSAQVSEDPQRPSRHGTAEMRLLRSRLAKAPADIQAEAERYLSAAPAGMERPSAARVAGKTGGKTLQNRVITDNFSVEWGSELTNENGTLPAADTGPAFSGDPAVGGNDVPDVVERWAAYLEASFAVVIDELGFAPVELSISLVPVYLGNSDPTTNIDDINSTQLFGFTDYAGTGVPNLVVNNDFNTLLGLTSLTAIQPVMKVTAAHEFFHVLHFLYEPPFVAACSKPDDLCLWREDIWWWEASATWMEDEVFDSVNDYHSWFQEPAGWTRFVGAGLAPLFSDAHYAPRAYGAVIFAKYLEEHVGGRDSMWLVWERIRAGGSTPDGMRVLDALGDYAASSNFDDLEQLFLGFVGANAVMDYEEGAEYGQVDAPSPLSGTTPEVSFLGAAYQSGSAGSGPVGVEVAAVPSSPSDAWGLTGVLERAAGFSLTVAGRSGSGTDPTIEFASVASVDSVFVAPSQLAATGSASFTLSEAPFAGSDPTPPAAAAEVGVVARPGGFDLVWSAPPDIDLAGHVVRWRDAGLETYSAYRTLFGPVTGVEVRGLSAGEYDVQVFAYDEVGNADSAVVSVPVTVAEAGSDATVPGSGATIPNALLKDMELGTPPSSGGGGGGGGCFLQALGF